MAVAQEEQRIRDLAHELAGALVGAAERAQEATRLAVELSDLLDRNDGESVFGFIATPGIDDMTKGWRNLSFGHGSSAGIAAAQLLEDAREYDAIVKATEEIKAAA